MSVNSYLDNLASNLIIRNDEKVSIKKSFDVLCNRLKAYFGNEISFVKKFGSYHRETILPTRYNNESDVDIMIKFSSKLYQPQTYLNKLKEFAEHYYSRSEIYQSHPTIVLKLNHIKFELVPCIDAECYENGNYKIPAKANDYQRWMLTSPFDFNAYLIQKNKHCNYKIKPLIRIMKKWNTKYKVYSSFELEQKIVERNYYLCAVLKDYFYDFIDSLDLYSLPYQSQRESVGKLINKVNEIKKYENLYPDWAENELKKFLDI